MKSMNFLLSVLIVLIVALNFTEEKARKHFCVVPIASDNNGPCSVLAFCMQHSRHYFTNNTEVHFTTGEYHLNVPLSVSKVTKLSITGDKNVTIWCHSAYILFANSALIEIRDISFINCGVISTEIDSKGSLTLHNVISFTIANVTFQNSFGYAITGNNIQGNGSFENVKIFQDNSLSRQVYRILQLSFQETDNESFQESNILISGCKFYNIEVGTDNCSSAAIEFTFQLKNPAEIQIINTTVENITSNSGPLVDVSYSSRNRNDSKVAFLNSNFTNNNNKNHSTIEINIFTSNQMNTKYLSLLSSTEKLPQWSFLLLNCVLRNNTSESKSILSVYGPTVEYNVNVSFILHINFTHFSWNKAKEVFSKVELSNYNLSLASRFVISNCSFAFNTGFGLEFTAIEYITFDGANIFYNNSATNFVILFNRTIPLFIGKNEFLGNTAGIVMHIFKYVTLMQNAQLNFSSNRASSSCVTKHVLYVTTDASLHPCIFQFTSYSVLNQSDKIGNIINFNENLWYSSIIFGASLNSCYWVSNCVYANTTKSPGEVYGYIIHYNRDNNLISRQEAAVCYCHGNISDCIEDHFNPIGAGRTVHLKLKLINSKFSTAVYINSTQVFPNTLVPACDLPLPQPMFKVSSECTTLSYSITSNLTGTCSLYLTTTDLQRPVFVYYATLQKCPLGFVWLNGKCDCDPVLTRSIPYMKCDSESASILHAPISWIGVTEDQMDYMYKPDCISYYCSPDFFFMQLQNPDVQCLHNRTGLICGHCPSHLGAMLGSLQCSKCSNYWLLLIPVFLIIGIILVLVLFVLNLTVAEGKINGFILYANVLNTFMYKVFPVNSFSFVAVSLANLDWGIETCFYHGMTDYAKVWLRFLFPIYLFVIVLVMILASRHSQRIEKLTRKRVIPVIATIFLLSYNKILLATNTALFYYIKVYKLRSNETVWVWGLDTSVPLFGVKFLILFVTCLLIFFLILVPINVLLLFTKLCYRSKLVIKYLKPFLDAYHAPIKDSHCYFLGVEFILRAIVFILGNNLLEVYKMLAVCIFIILLFSSYLCAVQPFKKTVNNIIYITFVYTFGLVAVLNIAFKFEKNSLYILLFNISFAMSFMLFLGIVYYHTHKYILRNNRTYYRCFTSVKNSVTQCIKNMILIQKCCNPDEHPRNSTPPIEIDVWPLQEELLDYEN